MSYNPAAGGGSSILTITNVNVGASPYTVLAADQLIVVDSSGGPVAILLPIVATSGRAVYVKSQDAGTNNVTVTAFATNNIDGAATLVQAVNMVSNTLVSDLGATGWHVI